MLKPELTYNIEYDKLVIGVGAVSNTFGVPGVSEHAFFLKVLKKKRTNHLFEDDQSMLIKTLGCQPPVLLRTNTTQKRFTHGDATITSPNLCRLSVLLKSI